MKKKFIAVICFVMCWGFISNAQDIEKDSQNKEEKTDVNGMEKKIRDPFASLIYEEIKKDDSFSEIIQETEPEIIEPEKIDVQGIIYSENKKQIVVNGKVYREGDKVEDSSVEVIKIFQDRVNLLSNGIYYSVRVKRDDKINLIADFKENIDYNIK